MPFTLAIPDRERVSSGRPRVECDLRMARPGRIMDCMKPWEETQRDARGRSEVVLIRGSTDAIRISRLSDIGGAGQGQEPSD